MTLESRYRRLLKLYPEQFRKEREDEMVTTLLDTSRPGQKWPSARETASLAVNALQTRSWLRSGGTTPGLWIQGLRLGCIYMLATSAIHATVEAYYHLQIRDQLYVTSQLDTVSALIGAFFFVVAFVSFMRGRRSIAASTSVVAALAYSIYAVDAKVFTSDIGVILPSLLCAVVTVAASKLDSSRHSVGWPSILILMSALFLLGSSFELPLLSGLPRVLDFYVRWDWTLTGPLLAIAFVSASVYPRLAVATTLVLCTHVLAITTDALSYMGFTARYVWLVAFIELLSAVVLAYRAMAASRRLTTTL